MKLRYLGGPGHPITFLNIQHSPVSLWFQACPHFWHMIQFPMVYVFTITALRVNFTQCSYIVMVSSISTIFTSNYHHQKPIKWTLPYSGKLSREKTFMNFAVLWLYTKVFSAKFGAWHPLARQKRAIHESFLCEIVFFTRKFSPSKVSHYTVLFS